MGMTRRRRSGKRWREKEKRCKIRDEGKKKSEKVQEGSETKVSLEMEELVEMIREEKYEMEGNGR